MSDTPPAKHIKLAPSGKRVPVSEGDSILSALERQGYALPNNCRAGACGECKAKVLNGDYDQGMIFTMALSDEEIAAGFGLMCMASPTSNLVEIEYGTIDAQPKLFPPRTDVPFVVVAKTYQTKRILELRLRPIGQPLRYWPGQYVQLEDINGQVPPRCYSIANAPIDSGEISLLVTRVVDGKTSTWIHDVLQPGDTVITSGPFGTFVGDPATDTPVLCLAAGSGLAPILALTDAALRRGFPQSVTLVVSASDASEDLAVGLLRWWEATNRNFRALTTYTRPREQLTQQSLDPPSDPPQTQLLEEHSKNGQDLNLSHGESEALRGRIPTILGQLFDGLANTSVFIAGPPAFVDNCKTAALELGAAADLIHTEGYVNQFIPTSPPSERLTKATFTKTHEQ